MFTKILIANRGEIVIRIAKTARKLGIIVVGIYSPADADQLFVKYLDEAYQLLNDDLLSSYLDTEQIIKIAKKSQAQAIHPGYGFLSENSYFAQRCTEEKITFIGPSVANIKLMASKYLAKNKMSAAGLPIMRSYCLHNEESNEEIIKQANIIGFPLLLKADAGGGGKAMRIVNNEEELFTEIATVRREGAASFANDTIIFEQYLANARHIEVQVFLDKFGNGVHLFTRDCSLQRRYQKIIEEAPARDIDEKLLDKICQQSVVAAQNINYIGAGTFEYLYQHGKFYFLEMNTRLQVEHTVTEEICQIDLVLWQLKIAAGEKLPKIQKELSWQGHAIEARIYAENILNNFLPTSGSVTSIKWPTNAQNLRIDHNLSTKSTVSTFYDSMLAKFIVHCSNRQQAIDSLYQQLLNFKLQGIAHNVSLLKKVLQSKDFRQGINTDYLTNNYANIVHEFKYNGAEEALIFAIIYHAYYANNLYSQDFNNFRLNHFPEFKQSWLVDDNEITANVKVHNKNICQINIHNKHKIQWHKLENNCLWIKKDNKMMVADISFEKNSTNQDKLVIYYQDIEYEINSLQYEINSSDKQNKELTQKILSPIPGKIISLLISNSSIIKKGQKLLIIEAMKMEHNIIAEFDCVVDKVLCNVGDIVTKNQCLLTLAQEEQKNNEQACQNC